MSEISFKEMTMKKITAILICLMLIISFAGCFGDDDENNNTNTHGTNQNDGMNGGGSGGFDRNGNSGTGSMNGGTGGNIDGGTNGTMNGNTNGGMNGNTSMIEDLTDAERESLRSEIDSIDGITLSDIRFEGDKAFITLRSTLDEVGDDVKKSVSDMVKAIRGGVRDIEFRY